MLPQDPEAFERAYIAATRPAAAAPRQPRPPRPAAAEGDSDDEALPAGDDAFTTVGKGGKAMQFSADAIFKTLLQVQEARGKKVS